MKLGKNEAEIMLNGILDEELDKYYHICFYTDDDGPDFENSDHYIFVPKSVCRIIDKATVSILDWYVKKKKLMKFMRGRRVKRHVNRSSYAAPKWKKSIGSFRR